MRVSKILLSLVLLLAGCRPLGPATPRPDTAGTQAALDVYTAIAQASSTPTPPPTATAAPTDLPTVTPTATITPGGPTPTFPVTAQPGLDLYVNPDIPDYVFQIDPGVWEKDPSGRSSSLVHKSIDDCKVINVPGHGVPRPERVEYLDLGAFRWRIMDYGSYAYADGMEGHSFLELHGLNSSACRKDLEAVLAGVLTVPMANKEIAVPQYSSPTPRPPLAGFDCPGAMAARLRVGDEVMVATDGLWLRAEPRADNSTRVKKFSRGAPMIFRVVDGPVCDKFVYWKVEISNFGEAADATTGWFAEAGDGEVYLRPVK